MSLRVLGETVYLSEFLDNHIAIKFDGDVEGIDTDFEQNATVPRADIVVFTEKDGTLTASFEGQGLIFQKAIANQIRGRKEWAVGLLRQVDHEVEGAPDATIYQLAKPEYSLEALSAAMEAASIEV